MTQNSSGINLIIPPAFASGSNIDFQIKKMDNTSFFNSVSSVPNKRAVGTQVYNLKALSDATTTVSSFSKALTVTMNYSSSDVVGINESSLTIKRWDGSSWNDLSNCTVDTTEKSVTCETSNFSDFAIFGDEQSTSESTTTTTNNSSQSTTISSSGGKAVIKLPGFNSVSVLNLDKIFKKNLDLGSKGNDVRYLQSILVELGYLKHSITGTYATLTKQAVRKFQIDHKIKPVTGTFGPKTKAVIMKLLRK
jgi:transcriptional regulator with GAF, ATPase, and Fis domain